MSRRLLLLLPLVLAACGGGGDGASTAACDLLPLATAKDLVGDDLERIRVIDVVPDDAPADVRADATEADARSCIYAPPGTGSGDEPDTAAAIQLDRGLYANREELLAASKVGGILEGVGRAAIIEEEAGGYTIVVLVDDELSFALVIRSPDLDRAAAVDLAKEIESKLD